MSGLYTRCLLASLSVSATSRAVGRSEGSRARQRSIQARHLPETLNDAARRNH